MSNLVLTTSHHSLTANSQPEELYDGYFEEFFDNGLLRRRGVVRDGYRIGYWEYYHENGELKQAGAYGFNGKRIGLWDWYYENGEIRWITDEGEGYECTLIEAYDEDGRRKANGSNR